MRSKEGAQDYRYFPEPDLPAFIISKEKIEEVRNLVCELPLEKSARFVKEYGLSESDAALLTVSKKDAGFSEECIKEYPGSDKKPVVNWLIGPLSSEANNRNCRIIDLGVKPRDLNELIGYLKRQELSNLSAKAVLTQMIDTKKSAAEIIKEKTCSRFPIP